MTLVFGQEDIKLVFKRNWSKFVTGILLHGENSSRKKDIKKIMDDVIQTG